MSDTIDCPVTTCHQWYRNAIQKCGMVTNHHVAYLDRCTTFEIHRLRSLVRELVGVLGDCDTIIEYHAPNCKAREVAEEILKRIPEELK